MHLLCNGVETVTFAKRLWTDKLYKKDGKEKKHFIDLLMYTIICNMVNKYNWYVFK